MYKYIFFDLDGTLVDTSKGIINAAQYALDKLGIEEKNYNTFRTFIGPPLKQTFQQLYHFDEKTAEQATILFREYYKNNGLYQCVLYENIPQILHLLYEKGYKLYVATSKPTVFATKILEYLNIISYFIKVVGSNLDNTMSKKSEIIKRIMQLEHITENEKVLMVGDKLQDLSGAKECHIHGIGVLYGFGSKKELLNETHEALINSPKEILTFLEQST